MGTSSSGDRLEPNKKALKQLLQGRDKRDTKGRFAPALGDSDNDDLLAAHSLRRGNRDRNKL